MGRGGGVCLRPSGTMNSRAMLLKMTVCAALTVAPSCPVSSIITCVCVCVCVCVRACVRACARARVRACERACVCVWVGM